MTGRAALYVLLAVVGGAAAVLSYVGLRDLAVLVHFSDHLAPLLPVVLDAGAVAGSLVWLGVVRLDGLGGDGARRFARALVLALLAASVGGNALGHALEAFGIAPQWWLIAAVSAVGPAALGALVHLAVLVERARVDESPPAPTQAAQALPGVLDAVADHLIGADWDALMRPWQARRQGESDAPGGPLPPGREVALPEPPDRAESDDVLVADLRAADRLLREAGLPVLRVDGVRARYGVGGQRGSRLRRVADEPPGPPAGGDRPPARPHLVRDEETAV